MNKFLTLLLVVVVSAIIAHAGTTEDPVERQIRMFMGYAGHSDDVTRETMGLPRGLENSYDGPLFVVSPDLLKAVRVDFNTDDYKVMYDRTKRSK